MQGDFSKKVKKRKKTIDILGIRNNYNTISAGALRHNIGRVGGRFCGYWMVICQHFQHSYTSTV